jgi:hypothetical protein
MDKWNIIFNAGATYEQNITVEGVDDIATATMWRVTCSFPSEPPFVIATTANGMIIAGATPNAKTMVVSAADTALFPIGNARFDFDIEWESGDVVRRYYANGSVQINPSVGA